MRDQAGQRLAKREGSAGLEGWRALGGSAEGLIGQWAAQLGWLPQGSELCAQELLSELKQLLGSAWITPEGTRLIPKP